MGGEGSCRHGRAWKKPAMYSRTVILHPDMRLCHQRLAARPRDARPRPAAAAARAGAAAQCDADADVASMWQDVWEESAASAGAGLRLHVREIVQVSYSTPPPTHPSPQTPPLLKGTTAASALTCCLGGIRTPALSHAGWEAAWRPSAGQCRRLLTAWLPHLPALKSRHPVLLPALCRCAPTPFLHPATPPPSTHTPSPAL